TASSSDAYSGIASYGFPTLPSGWSVSGTGSSRTYSYTANPTAPSGNQNVSATNNAGLSATTAMTFTADSTAPSGQSVALSGGPYYTTLSVPLTLGNGSDAGSGINASSGVVQRASATLSNGSCGTFGSYATVTLSGGADTSVASGNCYHYIYFISDNVGNQSAASAASADAKVDTSAPSAPSLTLSESSPLEYATGTTLYYNPQGSNSGSFSVTGTTSDTESGIASIAFPTVFGSDSLTD